MNISSRSQPFIRFQKQEKHFFEDKFKEIQEKLRAFCLVDSEGNPNEQLLSCPLPSLTEEEKKAAYETLKQKICYDDPENGVRLTATPEDIEKALDEEIGLSSLILCGSKLIEILGVSYWIRALETAYEFLFGLHLDVKTVLGKETLQFLEELLKGAPDTDFRNYFKGPYISLNRAQDCVLACLANLNDFKNDKKKLASILKKNKYKVTHLDKCPLDIIRCSNIFDKFTTRPNGFAVVSLQNIEIINIKSLKRSDGILTSGSLKLDLFSLFRGQTGEDIRPESNLGNGWMAIFHIMQGLILPSDETAVEDGDILKAWRRAARGHRYGDPQKIYRMLEEFIKVNETPEKIAQKLIEDHKNHLNGSKNGGAAVLFHSLQSFYKSNCFTNAKLSKIVENTQKIWRNSDLAPFFQCMCGKNALPFPSVYAALCFNYLNEFGLEVKIKLGKESKAIITINLREGLCWLNLKHIPFLFHEDGKIPIELSLAQKLFKKDKIIFASQIKKLIVRSLEKGPSPQKKSLDTIWDMAKYLLEQQQIELGLDVFSAYIAGSSVDTAEKIKGFFRLLNPLVKNSIKILCGSRIVKILDVMQAHSTSDRKYLADRCLSLTRYYLKSEQPKQAVDLWLYSQSKGYFAGFSNEQIHKLQMSLFSKQLAQTPSDNTNRLLQFIFNSANKLSDDAEKTLISLLMENDDYLPDQTLHASIAEIMKKQNAFATGLTYFSNLSKQEALNLRTPVVAEFCLECIDKAKETNMEAANCLFKNLISSYHVKKFNLIPELAITFTDYNRLSDVSFAYKCLDIYLQNSKDLSESSLCLILEFCDSLIKNYDIRFFSLTKQILPMLKRNPQYATTWSNAIQSACSLDHILDLKHSFGIAHFFISQKDLFINSQFQSFYKDVLTQLCQYKSEQKLNIRLDDKELLTLIKIVRETHETRDFVWIYLSFQAANSENSKVKKECWNCFIKVLERNKNKPPFRYGDAFIYLCHCLDSAPKKDVVVMIQLFSKMRKRLKPDSPISPSYVLNAYAKILTSIYSTPQKSQDVLKIICDSFAENEDLIERYVQLNNSKAIKELYCFALLDLQLQEYFTKGVNVFSELLRTRSNQDKTWLGMVSIGINSIALSPFMSPENPTAEFMFTLLIGGVNKEDLDIVTVLNSCAFYLKFCQPGYNLNELALKEMIALFDYLVQQIPFTNKKFLHKLPAIAKSLVEAIKNNPTPSLLKEFLEIARFEHFYRAFGKDTASFRTFFHLILSTKSENAIFYASNIAQHQKIKNWLGNRHALEIECHRKLIHTEIFSIAENVKLLGDYYIECLSLNCAFELFEEIHSLIIPYLVGYFCLEGKTRGFNTFFQRITDQEAHCHSFYFKNTLKLMKALLDNSGFGFLMKVKGMKNPIKGVIKYFSAYLSHGQEITSDTLDIAEQFLERIFSNQIPCKAQEMASNFFELLLNKIDKKEPPSQLIKADYLIHFESKYFERNPENDTSLISDLIVSLVSQGTPWGIARALYLFGHHKEKLKENNIEHYEQTCLKLNIIFHDYSERESRNRIVNDIITSIQSMAGQSKVENLYLIFGRMLEACSDFIVKGKTFCPLISDIYGCLIHKFYEGAKTKDYPFIYYHTAKYFNSVFIDSNLVKKLTPLLIEGYKALDIKTDLKPSMEACLIKILYSSSDINFANETARTFLEIIPESTFIKILATSKVEEDNEENHSILQKIVLKFLEGKTAQSFAHAMFFLTRNLSCMLRLNPQLKRHVLNQIKVRILCQLPRHIDLYLFLNELNRLLLIHQIDSPSFYDDLISVLTKLVQIKVRHLQVENDESSSQLVELAKMPVFFYKIYYSILFSISQNCNPDKIPSILQKWRDYYSFLTNPDYTDLSEMIKNEKDNFPLMLYTPFELFKSLSITSSQNDSIEQTFFSGIELLTSQYPEKVDALQCALLL